MSSLLTTQYAIKEVMNFMVCTYSPDPNTAKPFAIIDYAQVTGLEHTSSRILVKGGWGNATLAGFDSDKEVKLNLQLPLVDFKLLSFISGAGITKGIERLTKIERLSVQYDENNHAYVPLSEDPLDGTIFAYTLKGERSLVGESFIVDPRNGGAIDSITEGHCTVKVVDGKVRLYVSNVTAPKCSELSVTYSYQSREEVERFVYTATKFPKYCTLRGEALMRNTDTGEDVLCEIIIYKAHIQPNFTNDFSATDPTVLNLVVDTYAHTQKDCSNDKNKKNKIHYSITTIPDDQELGTITLSNVPDPTETGVSLQVRKTFALGIEQENVIIDSPSGNDTHFTIDGNVITGVSEGTGNITLRKPYYEDLVVKVTVTNGDSYYSLEKNKKLEKNK